METIIEGNLDHCSVSVKGMMRLIVKDVGRELYLTIQYGKEGDTFSLTTDGIYIEDQGCYLETDDICMEYLIGHDLMLLPDNLIRITYDSKVYEFRLNFRTHHALVLLGAL